MVVTNEARLKTAIDYLESEVEKDDIFIVDSFEKDFREMRTHMKTLETEYKRKSKLLEASQNPV